MGQMTLAVASGAVLALPVHAFAALQDAAANETEASPAAAPAALHYVVKVDAPDPLDDLLEKNLDLFRFQDNPRTDREQLQRLVRGAPEQVRNLVATAGFYTPDVSVRLDDGSGTPTVHIKVEPGQPVVVGQVELVLQGFDTTPPLASSDPFDTDALKASWTLQQGQVFRQAEWEQAKRGLLRQVVQTRYPRAQLVDTEAQVDPDTHTVALKVVLDSGPELRFGELRIEGLKRYPASVIRNLNQIHPGDYYDEASLQAYQARLQDTGYFASVEVSADMSSVLSEQLDVVQQSQEVRQDPAAVKPKGPGVMAPLPLLVRVTENKQQNVSAGLGYSTNTGNRAQLNYDNLNVMGLKLKSALTMETKKQSARGDFYFPTTPDGYNDSVGASFERSDISNEITSVSTIAAKRRWGTPQLERSLSFEFLSEGKTVDGLDPTRSKSLPLTFSLTKRRLDNLLFPSQGYVINAQLGGALLPILTDERFVRGSAKFVYYQPVGAKGTVIVRGEGGALGSKEKAGVPAVYLFRAGGDQSVRGYAYQDLGVREGDAIVGGRYLATASAEYQYWFKPKWGAAAFYDAGNAADTLKDLHPKSGYGLGVRYKSPVGPINVDVAYGHAVQKYRMHFSLGFTF
ncbi:autotransporter assembly complex protein TamA [Janthinobacterium agaricidamnosum]|nr:autotransporter assembly complex family protein [Janthinobacterium agaricidamnosum]